MKAVRLLLTGIAIAGMTAFAGAQTVDEIVAKHVEAIGGKSAWDKVTNTRMEGVVNVQGTDVNITLTKQKGRGMRQDIAVMGMTGFQIITPTNGWTYMPFQGQSDVDSMASADVQKMQDAMEIGDPLMEYKQKGYTAELAGKETINGSEASKIVLTKKDGSKQTVFVDNKTYYIVRMVSVQSMNGQEQEVTNDFSNFQKLPEGIVVPMTIGLPFGELAISKVEVNKTLDENFFKPIK